MDGEVIVVDGDAERSAESLVCGLGNRYPDMDVRYVASEPGAALQRTVGIDLARGDVVVFIDDDCTVEPGLFEVLASACRDPLVVGATGWIDGPSYNRLGSNNPHSRLRWLLLGGVRQGSVTSFGFRRPIIDVEQPRDVQFMPAPARLRPRTWWPVDGSSNRSWPQVQNLMTSVFGLPCLCCKVLQLPEPLITNR